MKKLFIIIIIPYHLSWSDFKGNYSPSKGEIASINIGLSWEYEQADTIVYNITAAAEFRSDLSYTGTTDPYILNHEQQHYNLSLIYSKKANSLLKLKSIFSEKDFQVFKSRIESEWQTTDSLYDAETEHSENKIAQIKWNKIIRNWLSQK